MEVPVYNCGTSSTKLQEYAIAELRGAVYSPAQPSRARYLRAGIARLPYQLIISPSTSMIGGGSRPVDLNACSRISRCLRLNGNGSLLSMIRSGFASIISALVICG